MFSRVLPLKLIILCLLCCSKIDTVADIIILSNVYTMEENFSKVEALVVKDNRIIFVGDEKSALKYKSGHTLLIQEPDGMILPGFIDSHVHLIWGGIEMGECQLIGLTSDEEIISKIETYVNEYPDLKWIRGNGWSLPVFKDGNPSKNILDKINAKKPMYFLSADGHSAWVNSKALSIAGLTENTRDPINGRIERDPKSGAPSGVLREDAMALVETWIPNYTKEQIKNGLHISVKEANKFGITSILDAGTESIKPKKSKEVYFDGLDAYREATENKEISLRVNGSQYVSPLTWRKDIKNIKNRRFNNSQGSMNTVKIFADGVIEAGTGALLEPYVGTNNFGDLYWDPDTLKIVVSTIEKEGFQIHFHAIGDKAIRTTLDAFEYARKINRLTNMRHMISHAQLIHPEDIARFKKLDIIASFQPLWAYPDPYMKELTIPVLGPIRSKWNYPLRSLLSSGARIAAGSDWSVTSLNPLYGIEVAITRQKLGSPDGEILNKDETVDLEAILEAYTIEGAHSLFRENEIGSLKKGKLADIILLDKNLFKIPPHEIHKAKVIMTIFNGSVVYSEKN